MSKKTQEATANWLEGLKRTGALTDDQMQALLDASGKTEFVDYIGETAMSRSDYSRSQNALQAEYQAKTQELTDYQKELANWRGKTEKEVSTIKAEAEQLRAERQRLVGVAQSYGLTESDLGDPVAPFTSNPSLATAKTTSAPQADPFDATKFISRIEAEEMGTMYTLLPAEIADIMAEHRELFGKEARLRPIVEKAMREKRQLREVYEEEYKVADRRSELADAEREAEIKRRVDEEIVKFRTENPEARIPLPGEGSFALRTVLPKGDESSTNQAFRQNSSVDSAVARWNSLEHKTE